MPTNNSSSSQSNEGVPYLVTHKLIILLLAAIALVIVSFVSWWKRVYTSPSNVFYGMISNNLSTKSVTRTTITDQNGTKNERIDHVSFVPVNGVDSITNLEQNQNGSINKVKSETIGTLSEDYNRYLYIETNQKGQSGQPLNYSSIVNIWSKADMSEQGPQTFNQTALGLVMFANLDDVTKAQVINTLNSNSAFDVQYQDVKPKRIDGRSALVIPVKVKVSAYVKALKIVAKNIGLTNLESLNPDSYSNQPPIEMKLTIDKLTRQLLVAEYANGQTETYSNYGKSLPVQKPQNAISISELQQKIQDIK